MPSFLDFDNPEVRTGLGLLALGQMPKSQGFAGLLDLANSRDTSRRLQAKTAMENAAFERQKQEWLAADQAAKAAAAQRAAIPSLFALGPAGEVAGFDTRRAIELGLTPKQIEDFANVRNVGRSEVARTVEGLDEQGRPTTFQFDKFGNRVGDGLQQWKAPISVNQGDKTTFVDAVSLTPKQSFAMGMSPEARDASARGWASNALARERLNFDMGGGGEVGPSQAGFVRQFGKPPAGFRWKPDGSLESIPGGPSDVKAGLEGEKFKQRQAVAASAASNTLAAVKDAIDLVGINTAGIGSSLAGIKGTDARDLQAKLETIKANLGFDRLQQMRDMSPTGGALGSVAVQELTALQSTVSSLDQGQSPAQLKKSLEDVGKHYNNWMGTLDGKIPQDSKAGAESKKFDALPPALQYNGKRMRGPDGTVYRSVNGQWTRE